MNQPPNPAPRRSARPHLFRESSRTERHADFGPSILATIDGGQPRFKRAGVRIPLKRFLWPLALLVLLAAGAALLRLNAAHSRAPRAAVAVNDSAAVAAAVPVDAAAASTPSVLSTQGTASIETVAVAAPAQDASSAAVPAPRINVAGSLSNIQRTLDGSEPVRVSPARGPARAHAASATRAAPSPTSAKAVGKSGSAVDNDAELLAAMLPHMRVRAATPTSPAFEKRCGRLSGDAAIGCRAKFCSGRQGVDAACPESPGAMAP